MSAVFDQPITGPGVWVGPEVQGSRDWVLELTEDDVGQVDAALAHVRNSGITVPFGAEQFPLGDELAAKIDSIPEELEHGLGFKLVRGIPRRRYSVDECELIYWGFGAHLGTPISQNARGHLLGHVRDEGKTFDDPSARGYQTTQKMDFHADQLPVDILGLFCVRQAKEGGASALVSALQVHNVLLEERPDLLEVLYQPFNLDWRGEEPEGELPWYTSPMFSQAEGKVTSRVTSRQYFSSVIRYSEELGLTPAQREALDAVQEISNRPELRLSMRLEEGDMQFLNNHAILHARDAFVDHEEPDLKRHLLRMWIALDPGRRRPLSDDLADRYRIVEMGGIPAKA